MGFYNESSFFDFPQKRIVDDVLERNGHPTEESFTPFNGYNFMIREIMNGPRSRFLSLDEIKENIEEFPVTDKLENINESDVVNYLRKKLIDLKNKIDACPEPINRVQRLIEMARNKLGDVPSFHAIYDNDDFPDPINSINQFLKLYKEVNKNSTPESEVYYLYLEEIESTVDCRLEYETLFDAYGRPLIFKGDAFLLGFGDTPMLDSVFFILTRRGYVIKVDDEWDFTFTTVKDILTYSTTKNMNDLNKKVVSLSYDD